MCPPHRHGAPYDARRPTRDVDLAGIHLRGDLAEIHRMVQDVIALPWTLVLAGKIVTAMQRGTANTRWRDFVDIANLAAHVIEREALAESIGRVAATPRSTDPAAQ